MPHWRFSASALPLSSTLSSTFQVCSSLWLSTPCHPWRRRMMRLMHAQPLALRDAYPHMRVLLSIIRSHDTSGFTWALLRTCDSPVLPILVGCLALLVPCLPFLLGGCIPFLRGAFDLTRTLVWDKIKVVRHFGRHLFAYKPFGFSLLILGLASVAALLFALDRSWRRLNSKQKLGREGSRLIALAILGSNQVKAPGSPITLIFVERRQAVDTCT